VALSIRSEHGFSRSDAWVALLRGQKSQ